MKGCVNISETIGIEKHPAISAMLEATVYQVASLLPSVHDCTWGLQLAVLFGEPVHYNVKFA